MISPFNFPINLVAHKVAPAIAAGCPFVLKPASRTPVSALILGEILSQSPDLPEGAFSVLPCSRDGADAFTVDERFKLVSFTGSPEIGWELKAKAGKKKVTLELGGNAACIVDREHGMELEQIANRIVVGAFYQSGQSCISVQRLLIHESIYEQLVGILVQKVAQLKMGDPFNPEVFVGPMISMGDATRIESWVDEAVARGANLLVGGKRDGIFYSATLVENVPRDAHLSASEAFGPVCCVSKFSEFRKAVAEVNDSTFGLQAGIFTTNLNHAFYAFDEIEAGGVVVGDVPSVRIDSQPYGGVKDSGFGREGLRYAIEDMTEIKAMLLKNAPILP